MRHAFFHPDFYRPWHCNYSGLCSWDARICTWFQKARWVDAGPHLNALQPDNSLDGSCKTTPDYEADFKSLETSFVRTYSSNECDTAANILPAAAKSGVKVILGVWSVRSRHNPRVHAFVQWAFFSNNWTIGLTAMNPSMRTKLPSRKPFRSQVTLMLCMRLLSAQRLYTEVASLGSSCWQRSKICKLPFPASRLVPPTVGTNMLMVPLMNLSKAMLSSCEPMLSPH